MVVNARANLRKTQLRYKRNFSDKLRKAVLIALGNDIFLDKPPLFTKALSDRKEEEPNSKLQSKTFGPFPVVHVPDPLGPEQVHLVACRRVSPCT